MAIRQSVLAMYGAIAEGLAELREANATPSSGVPPEDIRRTALELTGLTGSAGEYGWYDELLAYFRDHSEDGRTVPSSTPDDILADFNSTEEPLAPTVAYQAIAAAHVLDLLSNNGFGPARSAGRLLIPAIAASPSHDKGFNETGTVGPNDAEDLAHRLTSVQGIKTVADFKLELQNTAALSSAVKTLDTKIGLRKVKREYCTVATTTADWPDISYNALLASIEPDNWSKYFKGFFCEMELQKNEKNEATDKYGWTRIHEAVSGDCDKYRLRTALRFWKRLNANSLFINYDLDENREGTDKLVTIDNGYIWIEQRTPGKPDEGVRVRTSKQLLISGMSATALTKLAESLGFATNASDMFYKAAAAATDGKFILTPFKDSVLKRPPEEDTSPTLPVIVPELPPSLRDEMCRDMTKYLKDRIDAARTIGGEFAAHWHDGIDLDEYDDLAQDVGEEVKTSAREGFKLATENFRPKPATT